MSDICIILIIISIIQIRTDKWDNRRTAREVKWNLSRVRPVVQYIYLIYKDECMYVSLYLIQIHISASIGSKLCKRLLRGLEEIVGYVWTHITLRSPPIRPLPSRRPAWRWAKMAAGCAKMAARATGEQTKRYIGDSGTCSCDVTHTKSRRAAHSFCPSRALWVVRKIRWEDNGTRACKRGNQMTLREAEWLPWLSNSRSHVRVYIAGMRVYMWPSFSPLSGRDRRVCMGPQHFTFPTSSNYFVGSVCGIARSTWLPSPHCPATT
jgi:hypothetical protein